MNKEWSLTYWVNIENLGSTWRVIIRMTDNYNYDTSNWRGRIFLVKTYGYRGYNYFYFGFGDHYNSNNNF